MHNSIAILAPILAGWDEYQQGLVTALAPLTPDQLALRAAPHLRPVRDLAAHIVSTRAGWFHAGLGVGDDSLKQYLAWGQPDQTPTTAEGLVGGLQATWAMIESALNGWTAADLSGEVPTVRGGVSYLLPRQFVIWHLIEHDLHHGGELFLTLGVHNLPTPDVGPVGAHITRLDG